MSCRTPPTPDEIDAVSRLVSSRLAAFLRTLRDNGFAVGAAEGQDAAALMAAAALGLQAPVLHPQVGLEQF
jgi:uncharacterized protein